MAAEVRGLYYVADPNNFNFLPLFQSSGLYLVVHSKQRNHNDDLTMSFKTQRLAATLGLKMFSWALVKDSRLYSILQKMPASSSRRKGIADKI